MPAGEESFSICRAYGFQGVLVTDKDKEIVVSDIHEPCLAYELGYINAGDTIISIDDHAVSSETDLHVVEADTNVALMTVKIGLKSGQDDTANTIKRYGERYLNIKDAIMSMKSTLRKDHIDIAIATMQLGQCCLENGDVDTAMTLIEEALNNAYGHKQGINQYVCECYTSQAQIAYAENRGIDARRHLHEAIDVYKKIGESMDVLQFKTYSKLVAVASEDEDSSFRDTMARYAMELQQKIVVTQLLPTAEPTEDAVKILLGAGKVLIENGNFEDARECLEKALVVINRLHDKDLRVMKAETLRALVEVRCIDRKVPVARVEASSSLLLEDQLARSPTELTPSRVASMVCLAKAFAEEEEINTEDLEKAKEYLITAIRFRQQWYGRRHPLVAETAHFLAITYRRLRLFQKATVYHHLAIHIYSLRYGSKNIITKACVGALGITVAERGAVEVDAANYIVEQIHIELRRSLISPHNPMNTYGCAWIRNQFYDHYKVAPRIVRGIDADSSRTDNSKGSSASKSGGPADFLMERGDVLLEQECDFNSARVLFQQCYNFLSDTIGSTHNATLHALYRLADATRELGNYADAEMLYSEAADTYLENCGDKLALSYAMTGWGECYLIQGNIANARLKFSEALAIQKSQMQLGVEGVDTNACEFGLAKVNMAECKWSEAARLLDRLMNKVKADLGSQHLTTALVALECAKCAHGAGKYDDIRPFVDQGMVIMRAIKAEDHLHFAFALFQQAELYALRNEFAEALQRYEKCLAIFIEFLTEGHPIVYQCRSSMALMDIEQGRIPSALAEFEDVLKCREDHLGSENIVVAESHIHTGDCLVLMGQYTDAQAHFEVAEPVVAKCVGKTHPLYATVKFSMAECQRRHGYLEKAREIYAECMKIRRDNYGKEHPDYVNSMQGKADLDSNCDSNMEEVAILLKRIIKMTKKFYGEEHTKMAYTLNTYGMVLRYQGRDDEALEKFNEALRIRQAIGDPNHHAIAEIKNNIALIKASQMVDDAADESQQASAEPSTTPGAASGPHEPRAPTEVYEGISDQTPVFNNVKYRSAIAEMKQTIELLRETFPAGEFEHPLVANIKGNIGIVEKLEDEGKRNFILRLSTKQRSLFRDAEEKRLSEEFANMSADFSDAPAGHVKLKAALIYFTQCDYGHLHPWIRKFDAQLKLDSKDIPSDAEPTNAQQLKASRKLMEAREKMRLKEYDAAKRYYEDTLARLPDAEFRPEDAVAYAMAGECLSGLADIARIHCKLADSRDFYLRSLNILRKESDNESLQYADALLGYSDLLFLEGEFEESMINVDEVVKIKKRHLGEKHDGVVDCISRRVLLKLQSGEYEEGRALCSYVLDTRNGLKDTHEDLDFAVKIAEAYNTMAMFLITLAKYDEAEQCLADSLKMARTIVIGGDSMVIADYYHIKGDLRMAQYKYRDALRNYGHAMAMKLRIFIKQRDGEHALEDISLAAIPPEDFPHITIAKSLQAQADALRADGKFTVAADLYLKAGNMYAKIFSGADNPSMAAVMFGQAENYRSFAQFDNAEKLLVGVKSMRRRMCRPGHPDIADTLEGIGDLRCDQCRLQEALNNYQDALEIRLTVFGKDHPKIAASYLKLANIERMMGKYAQAEATYLKALNIWKPLFGEAHAATCPCFFGMAENYRAQERYNDANVLYTLIVSVVAIAFGDSHPTVGLYVVGQAKNLAVLGSYPESKVMAQRALQVFTKCYGADHPHTICALLCISQALFIGGRYEKAMPYFERCRDFTKETFHPEDGPHLFLAECLLSCGNCLLSLGRYAEAKEQFQTSLEIRRSVLTDEHLDTLNSLSGVAEAEKMLGNLPEAELFQEEAVTRSRVISGNKLSLFSSLVMSRLADTIRHRGRLLQAKQLHERALSARQTLLGGKHYLVADSQLALGIVIMEMGQYEEANGLIEKSLFLNKSIHREQHPSIAFSLYALAECSRHMAYFLPAEANYFKAIGILSHDLTMSHPDVVRMMLGFSENRKALGAIYMLNSTDPLDLTPDSPLAKLTEDFSPENVDNLYSLPILLNTLKYLLKTFGAKHYDVLQAKSYLAHTLLSLGQLKDAQTIQRELISGYRIHFGKEYMHMAPVLFGLAEIERMMEKVAAKKKLYVANNRPDLSAASITSGGGSLATNSPSKTKPNPSQKLPKIQAIAEMNKALERKKKKGYMGYEYPEVKTRDINPDSPVDHLIMNEIEVALRDREQLDRGGGKSHKNIDPDSSMINECSRLYDIALQLHAEKYHTNHDKHPFAGCILFGKAELLRARREFEDAHALYKKAHSIQMSALRGGHPLIACTLYGIAENLRMKGNLKDSQVFHDRALLMRKDTFSYTSEGANVHVSIAESKNGIAALVYDKGLYFNALVPCEESIVIRRTALGSEHYLTAQSEHLMANIHLSCHEYNKARPLYEHAIVIKKATFGPKHVQVITAMSDYALLLKVQGDYDRALSTFLKVMKSQIHLYGNTHPDIASSLNNIGAVHFAKGEFQEALPYYRQSLEMKRSCFGNDHAHVASSLHNLAGVYQSLQEYDRARELYEEALSIQTSLFDYFHPSIADTMNNLGILMFSKGQHAEAEASYERALEIKQHVYGKDHPAYASSLHNLGALQHAQGRLPEAKASYIRCRDIRLSHLGLSHPDTIACIENLRALKLQEIIDIEKVVGSCIEIYQ